MDFPQKFEDTDSSSKMPARTPALAYLDSAPQMQARTPTLAYFYESMPKF